MAGAEALVDRAAAYAVVDVLSFTTTVLLATRRGTDVYPAADDEQGRALAKAVDAVVAVSRRHRSDLHPWTLSPASIVEAPVIPRLVLPSPNGSAVSAALAACGVPVVAACLRNARAAAAWLLAAGFATPDRPVAVIAAGERWPDGSLRPGIEDLLGAGALLAKLEGSGATLAAEASVAALSIKTLSGAEVAHLVRESVSGRELGAAGHNEDVELAVALDADDGVPVMMPGEPRAPYRLQGAS
jgi:2-phosphosulfolactate phosphatase